MQPAIGIEEEYQLTDPTSGRMVSNCHSVLQQMKQQCRPSLESKIHRELHETQIEMASPVCQTLQEAMEFVVTTRAELAEAARSEGCRLVAAGTNPMEEPEGETITPTARYEKMAERFAALAQHLRIFGCHVHIEMPDQALGLRVMNDTRRYLPVLQALSANSPFWNGADTGYASYRREMWVQWPLAGPPPHFSTLKDYQDCIDKLIRAGAMSDESKIYWDIRLSAKVPTIEYRVLDTMTRPLVAITVAGLIRAMVVHAAQSPSDQRYDDSLLRSAMWQSARFGLDGQLIDPHEHCLRPAWDVIDGLVRRLEPTIATLGCESLIHSGLERLRQEGSGADRQRQWAEDADDLAAVTQRLSEETVTFASTSGSRDACPSQ